MSILAPDGRPARQAEQRAPRQKSWWQVYEAANRADFRGWFYLPTLSPAEQLDSLTRAAIAERIDWLYKNVGAVTMLIDRLALEESGTGVWPKWITGQADFDRAATDGFHYSNYDPRVFSADGHNDAYSVQYAIRRCIALYGDCFGQLIRPSPGALHPQLHLIPGYQCENFGDEKPGDGWQDGIRANALGRPVEYKFITGHGRERKAVTVPADDVLHFHDPFLPGQRRGVSALASVAKKLFRREDIGKAVANGTLARERLGFALETDGGAAGPQPPWAAGGEGEGETTTAENPDGTRYTLRKIFGDNAAEEVEVPMLPPGVKIKPVESNRPSPEVREFEDSILREAAWSRKYPPEFVFFMAGVGQGTVARGLLIAAGAIIVAAREFQLRPQFCQRYPVFWCWQMIKGGYFAARQITPPANWYLMKQIMPALPTMDVGREGALHDTRVATGRESIESYHGTQGEDASDVEDDNLGAIRRRFRKLKDLNAELHRDGFPPLTYQDVWSRTVNVPIAAASPAPTAGPAREKDDEEKEEEEKDADE